MQTFPSLVLPEWESAGRHVTETRLGHLQSAASCKQSVHAFYAWQLGVSPAPTELRASRPDISLHDPRPSPSSWLMISSAPTCTFRSPTVVSTPLTRNSVETASWRTLLTLGRKSDDLTHLARRLLSNQGHHKFEVSQFTEEEALKLIASVEPTVGPIPFSAVHKL